MLQHGVEMPVNCQQFAVINFVNSSAMNKPEKRLGLAHFKKDQGFARFLQKIFLINCCGFNVRVSAITRSFKRRSGGCILTKNSSGRPQR